MPIYTPGKLTLAKTFTWNNTLWNPSMISTALWLDAADSATLFTTDNGSTLVTDGSALGRWNDKSGNERNVAQATSGSRPTYNAAGQNNLGSIAFNGSSTFLQRSQSGFLSSNWTCAVAASNNAVTGGPCMFGQGGNVSARFQMDRNGTDARMVALNDAGSLAVSTQSGVHSVSSFIQVTTNDGSLQGVSLNGQSLTTTTSLSGSFTSTTVLSVGAIFPSAPSASAFWNGSIFEIVYAPVMLSTLNRQKIEGYLAHKWGLIANLPSTHPYKTVGPTP